MTRDGFIRRWSERKHGSRRGRAAPVSRVAPVAPMAALADPPSESISIDETIRAEPAESAEVLVPLDDGNDGDTRAESEVDLRAEAEAAGLPAPEDLNADSDYTGFLAQGVPEALTKAALRKLWLSNPLFANLDGLNDYDEDFNVIDRVLDLAGAGKNVEKVARAVDDQTRDPDGEVREDQPLETSEPNDETDVADAAAEADRGEPMPADLAGEDETREG